MHETCLKRKRPSLPLNAQTGRSSADELSVVVDDDVVDWDVQVLTDDVHDFYGVCWRQLARCFDVHRGFVGLEVRNNHALLIPFTEDGVACIAKLANQSFQLLELGLSLAHLGC